MNNLGVRQNLLRIGIRRVVWDSRRMVLNPQYLINLERVLG
jgi:hypothetical protein